MDNLIFSGASSRFRNLLSQLLLFALTPAACVVVMLPSAARAQVAYTGTLTTQATGIPLPTGAAADGAGHLYVSEGYALDALDVKEVLTAGGYTTVKTLISGLVGVPSGVAEDAADNIYVSESNGTAQQYEAASGYSTVRALATNLLQLSFLGARELGELCR